MGKKHSAFRSQRAAGWCEAAEEWNVYWPRSGRAERRKPSKTDGARPLQRETVFAVAEGPQKRQKEWYRKVFMTLSLCDIRDRVCFF